eukprot:2724823-Pleurochrysis_carterae.AAC.1
MAWDRVLECGHGSKRGVKWRRGVKEPDRNIPASRRSGGMMRGRQTVSCCSRMFVEHECMRDRIAKDG